MPASSVTFDHLPENISNLEPERFVIKDKVYPVKGGWQGMLKILIEVLRTKYPERMTQNSILTLGREKFGPVFGENTQRMKQGFKINYQVYCETDLEVDAIIHVMAWLVEHCGLHRKEIKICYKNSLSRVQSSKEVVTPSKFSTPINKNKDREGQNVPEQNNKCAEHVGIGDTQSAEVMSCNICPRCGNKFPIDYQFCCMCGSRLTHVKVCPSCGEKVPNRYKFCGECGYQFCETQRIVESGKSAVSEQQEKVIAEVPVRMEADNVESVDILTSARELLYQEGKANQALELLEPLVNQPGYQGNADVISLYMETLVSTDNDRAREYIDQVSGAFHCLEITLADIDQELRQYNLDTAAQKLTAAEEQWPDSLLLVFRRILWNLTMFQKRFYESDPAPHLEMVTEMLQKVSEPNDKLGRSWFWHIRNLHAIMQGKRPEIMTQEECAGKDIYYALTTSGLNVLDWPIVVMPGRRILNLSKVERGTCTVGMEEHRRWRENYEVTITKDFWINRHTIDCFDYMQMMGELEVGYEDDEEYSGSYRPGLGSAYLSWIDAKVFCQRLNEFCKGRLPKGYQFDIPTEAQWMYAHQHDSLYEVNQNAFEWCRDWYADGFPRSSRDYLGPVHGNYRAAHCCRSRRHFDQNFLAPNMSFRVALVPIQQAGDHWVDPNQYFSLPGDIKLMLREIPSGTFIMGSPDGEIGRNEEDEQQHRVTLSQKFWLGKFSVSQAQYRAVMENKNPSEFCNSMYPVERVTWNDAKEFCRRLNEQFHGRLPDGYHFNLPTEAQWEYACRAGTQTALNNGRNLIRGEIEYSSTLGGVGWYEGNSKEQTHLVYSPPANNWGLYNMHGNVFEWCRDYYGQYGTEDTRDPMGPEHGAQRVCRGGSWRSEANDCRSACRLSLEPASCSSDLGFRVALVPIQEMSE